MVSATQKEIQPLLDACSYTGVASGHFLCHFPDRKACHVLVTGVGIASTVFSLTKLLHDIKPDLIVQAGIAGSYQTLYEKGSAVLVKRDRFAGLGAELGDRFADVFEMGLADPNAFPFRDGWIDGMADQAYFPMLPRVDGITADLVTGTEKTRNERFALYQPAVESMEGAACFFVAAQMHIPALQVRTISNYIEKRNTANWNIPDAVTHLNALLIEFLQAQLA